MNNLIGLIYYILDEAGQAWLKIVSSSNLQLLSRLARAIGFYQSFLLTAIKQVNKAWDKSNRKKYVVITIVKKHRWVIHSFPADWIFITDKYSQKSMDIPKRLWDDHKFKTNGLVTEAGDRYSISTDADTFYKWILNLVNLCIVSAQYFTPS